MKKYYVEMDKKIYNVELNLTGAQRSVSIDQSVLGVNNYRQKDASAFEVHLNNKPCRCEIELSEGGFEMIINGILFKGTIWDERTEQVRKLIGAKALKKEGLGNINAPMPGLVVQYNVKEGDRVGKGQGIVIVEAMKMENEIASPIDGIVKKVAVEAGTPVTKGQLLAVIEE